MSRIRAVNPTFQASQTPSSSPDEAPSTAQGLPKSDVVPAQNRRFSVSGPQAARVFEIAARHSEICPVSKKTIGVSDGIPQEQAEWYENAHVDGVKQADSTNDGVSDTAVGNGWEYSDEDILGMVAPLDLEPNDSVLDVGCGDGYFVERLLRLLPQLQVRFSS
jgi:hypothetical protein